MREHGREQAVETLARVLTQADVACGSEPRPEVYELWASMLLNTFSHFSLESFVLAIREGLTGTKIYGKLNLPQVSEWMTAMDGRINTLAENEGMQNKFTGDNLGKDYLDRVEHDASSKDRTIAGQSRLIDQLRRKLDTNEDKSTPAA